MALIHGSTWLDNEPPWMSIDKATLPRLAYADQGEASKKATWRFPHHWVQNGSDPDEDGIFTKGTLLVHKGGTGAAIAALSGSRTGQDIHVSNSIRSELMKHRDAIMRDSETVRQAYLHAEQFELRKYGYEDPDIETLYSDIGGELVTADVGVVVPIAKADATNHIIYGVVYKPDIVDSHGHFMRAPEVEKMAWRYMKGLQFGHTGVDLMHRGNRGVALVVESFVAKANHIENNVVLWTKGAWVMGVEVQDNDVWEKIMDGKLGAFSLAGHASFGEEKKAIPGQILDESKAIDAHRYER